MSRAKQHRQHHKALRSIFIIADDLTGAADCAVQFRQAGFSALVLANPIVPRAAFNRAEVISLNLHTRDIPTTAGVRRAWRRFSPLIKTMAPGALVYQKIDSTLRGHPALEARLLLDLLGLSAAIITPAFPKLGRQTLDGVHRVHGVPLAATEYARTQTRTSPSSSLPEIFTDAGGPSPSHLPWPVIERGVHEVVRWVREHSTAPGLLITADAAHEQHLDIVTQAALSLEQRLLLVGSAGWAERLALACRASMRDQPPASGVLGVVGSLSAVARRQVQAAMEAGVTVIPFASTGTITGAPLALDAWQTLTKTLAAGRHVVIWTHPGDVKPGSRQRGQQVLRAIAGIGQEVLSTTAVSGLVIVGGDTAQTVLRVLRASGLSLAGEIAAGIPYGRLVGGAYGGLAVATKAGGFGTDTALRDCLDFMQRWAVQ
jgi:uncharacterized protein YgbK (DUF1537 family)